jgi:hypothetical protein
LCIHDAPSAPKLTVTGDGAAEAGRCGGTVISVNRRDLSTRRFVAAGSSKDVAVGGGTSASIPQAAGHLPVGSRVLAPDPTTVSTPGGATSEPSTDL